MNRRNGCMTDFAVHSRLGTYSPSKSFSQVDHQAGETKVLPMDGWDGYSAERNELVEFLQKQHIANPIVLTGDVHTNWVFDIKSDFDNPNSTTVGAEFAGTSVTSGEIERIRSKIRTSFTWKTLI